MDWDAGRYAADIDLTNDNDSHVLVIKMVGGGKRVLDVGCWNGDLAVHLAPRNVEVVGIERNVSAARIAAERIGRVVVGDVEEIDLVSEFGAGTFDVVVFGDVLEHLTDPGATLRRVKPLLAPGGSVVASIPNIAHGSVRLRLLQGEFRYTEVGLLDRTHLHFFTRSTLHDLFEDAGFVVVETRVTTVDPLLAPEAPIGAEEVDAGVLDRVRTDPEAHVYQFVVRAVPDDASLAIRRFVAEHRATRAENEELRKTARGRRAAHRTGLLQLAVLGAGGTAAGRWCASLLEGEIERRWPEQEVTVVADREPSTLSLRWADAVIRDATVAGSVESADAVVELDLSASRFTGLSATPGDDALLGVAMFADRLRKAGALEDRLPMLRILGEVPEQNEYLVVATTWSALAALDDLEGVAMVAQRAAGPGGIVLLPLDGASDALAESLRAAGAPPSTIVDPEATLEDVLAVLDAATAVVTTDPAVAVLAISFGRPHALLADAGSGATLVRAVSGGTAADPASIEPALLRTADPASYAPAAASVRAEIDDALDRLVESLLEVVDPVAHASEDELVAHLRQTVVVLHRRLAGERSRIAHAVASIATERMLDDDGRVRRVTLDEQLVAVEATAANYRRAIAELQEELHARTHDEPQAGPPARTVKRTPRQFAGAAARRLRLRGR